MNRTMNACALAVASALLAAGSIAPAAAATNAATLNVSASVSNNCDVLTQPTTLSMTYEPIQNIGTPGISSYTWICTNGLDAVVTPSSANNSGNATDWLAENATGSNGFLYLLYNDATCTHNQLSNGNTQDLGTADGTIQSYYICGRADTSGGEQNVPAGTYADTVTFTFNFPA